MLRMEGEDCIEWTGARNKQGYGRRWVDGMNQYVHRVVWVSANGPIPKGMEIRHTCDNPPCYNLEHLLLGTRSDNMKDRVERGRDANAVKTHCPVGHEYTPENTCTHNNQRTCRACKNQQRRDARRARNKRARTNKEE